MQDLQANGYIGQANSNFQYIKKRIKAHLLEEALEQDHLPFFSQVQVALHLCSESSGQGPQEDDDIAVD